MTSPADLRNEGQADVLAADAAAHRGYADLIARAVDVFGGMGLDFDAEILRRWIGMNYPDARPHSPNVIGATLGGLAAAGRIRAVGYRSSTRPSSRCRVLRIWQVVTTPPAGAAPVAAGVEEAGRGGAVPTPAPPSSPGWSH